MLENLRPIVQGLSDHLVALLDDPERLSRELRDTPEEKALENEARLRRDIVATIEKWRSLLVQDAALIAEAEVGASRSQDALCRAVTNQATGASAIC